MQKGLLLFVQLGQALAQPVELLAEFTDVLRAAHRHRRGQLAGAETADGRAQTAQRAADEDAEDHRQDQRQRDQSQRLPQQLALHPLDLAGHGVALFGDHLRDLEGNGPRQAGQVVLLPEPFRQLRRQFRRHPGHLLKLVVQGLLLLA